MTSFAVIGTGYWGENHARVAATLLDEGRIDDVTFCDKSQQRVAEVAERYETSATTDYRDLISDGVDAAVLATPSPTHYEIGLRLLEEGVDILVEKPLALDSERANELVSLAKESGRTLATGHIFRYHSAFRELQKRIDRGELGEVKHVVTNRYAFRTPRQYAGTLHSLAIHDLDLYTLLYEQSPDHLYCQTNEFIREEIDETASINLTFGNSTGTINVSWQIPVYGKRRDIVVVGSKRIAYIDYTKETTLELFDAETFADGSGRYISRNNGSIKIQTDQYEPLKREVEDFLKAIEGNSDPTASGIVGANAVYLVNKAQESAQNDKAVPCSDLPFQIKTF